MNRVLELMKERLKEKEEELKTDKDHIKIYAETEIDTSNYEKNTISILNGMIEIKSEINVLRHWIAIIENSK